jgi:hypothetical protein
MVQKRAPSAADVELAEAVTAASWPTTPRQVRSWRANGWVAKALLKPQGYARPTLSWNPEGAFEQALAVAQIRGERRMSPDKIVFGLFARGHPFDIAQLRRAYQHYFSRMRRWLEQATRGIEDPSEKAEVIAEKAAKYVSRSKIGRFMKKRAGRDDKASIQMVQTVFTVLVTAMLGQPLDQFDLRGIGVEDKDAVDELLDLTGMSGFTDDRIGTIGPIVEDRQTFRDETLDLFSRSALGRLERASQVLSAEQLVAGRNHLTKVLGFAVPFASVVPSAGGPKNAFGTSFSKVVGTDDESIAILSLILVAALADLLSADEVASNVEMVTSSTPHWEATRQLQAEVPRRLHRYFGIGGEVLLERASPEMRAQAHEAIKGFTERHPDLMVVLTQARGDSSEQM